MKNLLAFNLLFLLLPLLTQAQQQQVHPISSPFFNCAADEMLRSRPQLWLKQQQLEEQILAQNGNTSAAKPGALPYVLPLVVHIIHQNGAENISDDQVFAAVEHLNQAFAHEGYYAQLGDGVNTQIQFCLAKRDPDGQFTNGITRTNSALTEMVIETDDQNIKDLSRWNTNDYVNVWIVKSITSQAVGSGVAGYANFASEHGQDFDGLVCEAQFFGASAATDAVFIHEIGHYLNLYHTFQGGCPNTDCQASGDRVCDTPPDQATHTYCDYNSCHTDADDSSANNPFTSDVNDATENFMDYSPFQCYRSFTHGQGERMRFAIENIRNSLLASTGCLDACTIPITAAFSPSASDILTGETVVFSNQTIGATHFEWYLNGNLETTATNFSYQFSDTGNFKVQLKGFNSDPTCFSTAQLNFAVKCNVIAAFSVDTTEITMGESLNFTNTSTGTTAFEWLIDGVSVGTSPDLNYTFDSMGYHSVTLQATGSYCNSERTTIILVYSNAPCTGEVYASRFKFATTPTPQIFHYGPEFLPDGGMYSYAYIPLKGFLARFDAQGNNLWQELVNVTTNGIQNMCVLDDSSTIFTNTTYDILKINPDGTLAWSKAVGFPNKGLGFRTINTGDGVIIFNFRGDVIGQSRLYLVKFLSDGTMAWNRAYFFPDYLNIIGNDFRSGYAGENGFWMTGFTKQQGPPYSPNGGVVLRFDPMGNIIFSKRYRLNNDDNVALYEITYNKNDEFVVCGTIDQDNNDNLFNYLTFKGNANGDIVWAKKQNEPSNTPAYQSHKVITRPIGGYLQYMRPTLNRTQWAAWSEDGQLEFSEEMTAPGYMDDVVDNNGQLMGVVRNNYGAEDFYLFKLTDDGKPIDCVNNSIATPQTTDVILEEKDFPFSLLNTPVVITPQVLTTSPYPNLFTQTPVCVAPSPCIEFCENGLDDDGDGFVDCFDSDCPCFDGDTSCTISLNPLNNNKIKVPDANISIDSTHCQTDSFEVFLTICNLGSAVLPAGTPVAFYDENPTTSTAQLLFPPLLLAESLEKGVCKNIKRSIPATYNTTIFAVVNDDGTLPRPFNPTTDFPSTDQPECHYENNMASFSIQNQTPPLDLGPDISLCKNSVVELSASPGFQLYRWQDGSTNPNLTAFSPGKYWVDAFDACGFKQSDTVIIVLNSIAALDLPDDLAVCTGETVHLSATGFSQYTWSPVDSVSCSDCAEVTILAQQSITIQLTAAEGDCFVSDSVRLYINPSPSLQLGLQNGSCDTTARITANVLDGNPLDFDFFWSNGASGNIIHPVQSGTYTVTVSNSNGCTAVDSATLVISSDLAVALETTQIACGSGLGLISATVTGGSGQYIYAWSTGASTDTIAVNLPGVYVITVTDLLNTGCVDIDTILVNIRGGLLLNMTAKPVSCYDGEDGAASVVPVEGTLPYTWQWQGGQTDALLNGLSAGVYSVTVTDAIGCTGFVAILVAEPDPLIASIQGADSLICPDETTSLAIIAEGGTAPYAILWNTGQTDSLLTGINAGSYAVTVTDEHDCSTSATLLIESEPIISITTDTIIQASSPTAADGGIFVSISGGVSPFSFLWSNGDTAQNLQAVLPGTYTLTVTDAGGCMQVFSSTVEFGLASGQLTSMGWNVMLLPNPAQQAASAQLFIQSSAAQVIDIQLFDATGRFLWKDRFELSADTVIKKVTAPTVAGVHFLVLTNGQDVICLKWVVMD